MQHLRFWQHRRSLQKFWAVTLLFVVAMLSCWLVRPSAAIVTEQMFSEVVELQAMGQYRRACHVLLGGLDIRSLDCDDLIHGYRDIENEFELQLEEIAVAASDREAMAIVRLGDILRVLGGVEAAEDSLAITVENVPFQSNDNLKAMAIVSLGNARRSLGRRLATFGDEVKARNQYDLAADNYREAIAMTTQPQTQLRSQLNLLDLLVTETGEGNAEEVRDLKTEISHYLDRAPDDRLTMVAAMDFARTLTCANVQVFGRDRFESELYILPAIVRECTHKDRHLSSDSITDRSTIETLLNKAATIARNTDDTRFESYAIGEIGELYELDDRIEKARSFSQQALDLALSVNAIESAYRWEWQLGRLSYRQGSLEAAKQYYHKASQNLQVLRPDIAALSSQIRYDFRDAIEPVYREFARLLLSQETPTQNDLQAARQAIEDLQLAELNNFYRGSCGEIKQIDIDNLDPDAAILYTIVLDDRLEIILSDKNGDKSENHLALYRSSEPLPENYDTFISELRTAIVEDDFNLGSHLEVSQKIHSWLIPNSLKQHLEDRKSRDPETLNTLVFVLDEKFRNVPLGALHDGDRYLIENWNIAVTPGLRLFEPGTDGDSISKNSRVLLAGISESAPSFATTVQNWSPLNHVNDELTQIAGIVDRGAVYLNEEFVSQDLKNQLQTSPVEIVHLATHGLFSSNIEETFVLDWNEPLRLNGLRNLLLNLTGQDNSAPLELLVLSACQTATGDRRSALGMAGVAVRSGAKSTLATLWQVNDRATAKFMGEFYKRAMETEETKAEVLGNVQRAFLHDERYQHPYYWAPFTLVGNWL